MRVTCSYQGKETAVGINKETILISRPNGLMPDLDLSPDIYVSRQHACLFEAWRVLDQRHRQQIWHESEWAGDQARRRMAVVSGDAVLLGGTTLWVDVPAQPPRGPLAPKSAEREAAAEVHILKAIDTGAATVVAGRKLTSEGERRLALLFELPMQFGAETELEALLQLIMKRVVEVIPGAKRGALLFCGHQPDSLLLKAYVSAEEPAVSETLARRALAERRGFIWRRQVEGDISRSVKQHHIETGMYAPLCWQDKALGVICVDTPEVATVFTEDDLRFFMAVAQYAAVAVTNHQLQDDLRQNSKLLERLLTNFSPKIRAVLLERARRGRLQPGGDKSQVTILFCDIRNFTSRTAAMETGEVVDMLNDYFAALVQVIFQFDGTIDKFMGDAVLAVFGSPEPDARQQEKAVRAALAMQAAMVEVNRERAARGEVTCEVGIGVHCGEVLHGFIGAPERLEFTVIGVAVNRASRYCHSARDGEILISPEVYQQVFKIVQAEKTVISPKEGDLTAFRVTGPKE